MKTRYFLPILLAVLASACAPTISMTYHSDPEGAMLYVDDTHRLIGYTPTMVNYHVSGAFMSGRECQRLQGAMVRRASGAQSSTDALQACPVNGRNQQFVFLRPAEAPHVEVDAAMAAQVLAARQQAQQVPAIVIPPPQQLHCTTQQIGNQSFTNCY